MWLLLLFFTSLVLKLMTAPELIHDDPMVTLEYTLDGVHHRVSRLMSTNDSDPFIFSKDYDSQSEVLTLSITSELPTPIKFVKLEIAYALQTANKIMLAEGFQSWSHTREYDKNGVMSDIQPIVAMITRTELQGDYLFFKYAKTPGVIHANSYTYLRSADQGTPDMFIGSISDNTTGYTYFQANLEENGFVIYKDIEGKILSSEGTLNLKFFLPSGELSVDQVWKKYSSFYRSSSTYPKHLTGWTSWYDRYEDITEKDILDNLHAINSHQYPIDVFQIDDGFATVGDWLDIHTEKFPRGLGYISKLISDAGHMPGLWLAPFSASKSSKLASQHPEWLLASPSDPSYNQALLAGPNWGGFYALDIYNLQVREHLQHVFDVVIDEWGFKLLKLDFLFAAAMIPRHGKSRGEVMADAVDMITELNRGRAVLLGSGIPLLSAWGRFDYCRVSSDTSPWWEHTLLRMAQVRERVSTANALISTLHRWPMYHMFGNDPDVFFIRSNNNKLTIDERHTLLILNMILGQMLLMSDNVAAYSTKEHELYAITFPKAEAKIISVTELAPQIFYVSFRVANHTYLVFSNLSFGAYTVDLKKYGNDDSFYFEHQNRLLENASTMWHQSTATIPLRSHETRMLAQLPHRSVLCGSTGHLIPGWDIETMEPKGHTFHITTRRPRKDFPKHPVDVYIRTELSDICVDNKPVAHQEHVLLPLGFSVTKITI